jgi:hypothetical protein
LLEAMNARVEGSRTMNAVVEGLMGHESRGRGGLGDMNAVVEGSRGT